MGKVTWESPSGMLLFRISVSSSKQAAQTAAAALESRNDCSDQSAVVENNRIRMTPLQTNKS